MAKGYIPLPDGSFLTVRDDETPGEAILRAQRDYPEAFGVKATEAEPEGGFGAAFKAGVSGVKEAGLALAGRTGLMDEEAARKAIEEEQAYQRRTFAPTEEGFLEAPVTKTVELLGQSIPYMAAPLVAAGAAAALPVTGTAATVAGLGAAGLASGAQFTGTNLLRQMETGKSIGETDLGNAAIAAVPQAALDTLSLRMMPFIRNIFGQVGKDLTEEAALEVAKKTLKDGAADYALATGKTMGVEGLTETAQQALERLQAGLTMDDAEARDEYLQSFIGGAVLGGVLAPPGRYLERRGIQTAVDKREAEISAEEQRRQQLIADQEEARKGLGEADAPLLTAEEATMEGELLGPASLIGEQAKIQREEAAAAEEATTAERAQELQTTYERTINAMEGLAQDIGTAKDTPEKMALVKEYRRLEQVKAKIEEEAKGKKADKKTGAPAIPSVSLTKPVFAATKEKAAEQLDEVSKIQEQIKRAENELTKATDPNVRDYDKAESVTKRLEKLNAQLTQLQPQPSLFGEENVGRVKEEERLAAEEEANIQRGENVFNVSKRIIRQSRQQTEQEKETAAAQTKALERIEFGLENMGLSALGIPATRRKAIEEQINRGIVLPPTAQLLGISVDKRTTADKALPQIEDAMRALNEPRQSRLYDILNDRVQLLDEKGELTEAGRQAVADEAKMQELNRLRTVGLSKLDARAAEDAQARFEQALELDRQEQQRQELAAEAPATERFGRILEQQTGELKEPPAAEVMPGALGRSKNEIFGNFSDAVRELQTGKFLSAREGVPEKFSPEEKARNEKLRDQIFLAAREENVIKDRLKQPGVVRNAALSQQLQQRLTQVQTDLKKFRSGLTRAPEAGRQLFNTLKQDALKAADAYVNKSIAEIEAARLAGRRPALTDQERTDIELKLRTPFQVFVDRVSSTELKGRISSVPAALKTLEADLNEVVETAKGISPETDTPVETAPSKAPKAPRKEPTSRIETIARTLEDVEARLEETKPAGVSNVSFFEKRIKDLKEQLKLVEDASSVGGLAEYYDPKFSRKQITTSIDRYEKALADEKAKVRERESLTRVKEKLESERETTTEKAAKTREVPLVVARQNAINKAIDGIVANREEIGLIKRDDAGKEIRTGLTGVIYNNGVLAARLKKQVQGKRDPETRAQIKQLETEANAARKRVQLLGEINKRLAASLRNLGFDGFINKDGEYILRGILNEQQEPTKWAEEAGENKAKVVDAYNDATKKINDVRGQIAAQEDVVAESVREAKKAQGRIGQFDVASDKEQARKKYDEAKEKVAQERKKLNSLQINLEQEIENRSGIINTGTQPLKKARDKTEEKEGRRLTYDERASAVQALNKRIDATLKAAKPTQEQEALAAKMRAIQAGEIKTPTGKALPLTRGRRDFEQAMVAARPQDISTDVEALEKEYVALEAKFDAATSDERKKMGTRKTQITKKLKRLKEAKEVSIPVFTADTLFPTNNEMQSLLDAQKRYILDDLKDKTTARTDTLNTLIDVQAETMAKVVEAKLALSQAKSDLEKRNVKAALKKANDAYTRATALRYEEELKLADLVIDNNVPTEVEGVLDVVSIEDIKGTQQEVEASLEAYRKSDETDFRVGDTDFEVAVDEAEAIKLLEEAKKKFESSVKPEKPEVDLTRRRIVQAAGAALVAPQMPASISKAFQIRELTPDAVWKAVSSAENWFDSVVDVALNKLKKDDIKGLTNLRSEALYNAFERIAGEEAAMFINSLEYADPIDIYLDDFIEANKNDPQILSKIQRAYDVAAVDIFKALSQILQSSPQAKGVKKGTEGVAEKAAPSKGGPSFTYYRDFSEVPLKILKALAKQGMSIYADKIKGGVTPDGEVFVIISHHKDLKDLEKTLAHELVGHYTLEGVLGKDGVRRLLKRVETSFPGDAKTGETGVFALAKELGVLREAGDAWLESVESTKELVAEGKMTKAQQVELAKMKALREVLAYTTENYFEKVPASKAGPIKKFFQELVFAFRRWLAANNFVTLKDVSTPEIFSLIKSAYKTFDAGKAKTYRNTDGTISLRSAKPKFNPTVDKTVIDAVASIIEPPTPAYEKLKANLLGLNFRTQFVDRIDALERIKRIGQTTLDKAGKAMLDHIKATDLTYFVRKYDQRMSFVSEAATNGVVQLIKDAKTGEFKLSRDLQKDAASLKKIAIALSKAKMGDMQANGDFFTTYMAAERALSVGPEKLGTSATPAQLEALRKAGRADPAIQEARKLYNEYNNDLINLLEQTGAISKERAAAIKSKKDYVPYYRTEKGVVDLFIDKEKILKIGDLTEQPYLKDLVGSDQKIRDFFTTSLQNTNMIMDLALRNLATRNVGFVLQGLGIAKRVGSGKTGTNIIRAKLDGKDEAWEIDTDGTVFGDIPAETIVQGLDGIKTTLPGLMKIFSVPSGIFRKFITRDPAYAIRQIFRDSTAAYMATGSDAAPVLGALKELKNIYGKDDLAARQLMAAGLSGGQVVTGTPEDMQKIIQQIASGKPGWDLAMAKLDGFAMAGDLATRIAAFKSFLKQGLTEREAELAALEVMNFSRRGVSPSVLFLNSMIPFLSANIQGLDVLFRAFKGQMGYNERLKVQEKLLKRGVMVALMTGAYALAMDDDETYENARPSERYSNWFVPIPGVEGSLRVPIPFELGLIFKVLPEALIRAAASDEKGSDIVGDMKDMLMKSIPGDIPLVLKPAIETMANYSFFTNSAVVGARLSGLDSAEQYTDKTPELLKALGALGISPAKAEYLVRGYTGSLGIGLLGFTDAVFSPARFAERIEMGQPKDFPLLGRLLQPTDGGALIDKAYNTVEDARIAQRTYNAMMNEGRTDDARAYLNKVMEDIQMSSAAGTFTQIMGEIALRERQIKASTDLSPAEKREKLKELRQKKIDFSKRFQEMRSRVGAPRDTGAQTERQAA
jgi:nitroreductase